jgi:DNA-binding NarL/FixJ family response regulator
MVTTNPRGLYYELDHRYLVDERRSNSDARSAFRFYDLMNPTVQPETKSHVLVVEDYPVLCAGLKQLIDSQPDLACVGVADDISGAKQLVEECKPDLMVLDLRLKGGDSLDFIKKMRVEHPEVKMLILSQYDELIFAERALRAGASGYIMKENATDEVLRAVRKVLAGELYFSERVAAAVVQRTLREKPDGSRAGVERLSDREMQVFQLLGAAYSAREIAEQFHLSRKTIETHCEKIKHKLSLFTAAELKRFARQWAAENLTPFEPWVVSSSQNVPSRK